MIKTTKTRMIKGSIWLVKEPISLTVPYRDIHDDNKIKETTYNIEVGSTLEISGKGWGTTNLYPMPDANDNYDWQWVDGAYGTLYPVVVDGNKPAIYLPYKVFAENTELTNPTQILVWALRDSETGLYYQKYDWMAEKHVWGAKPKLWSTRTHCTNAVLTATGYYEGMDTYDTTDDWLMATQTERNVTVFKNTWEAVCLDKITKQEISKENLTNWYVNTTRLRELTLKYSSAVRTLYKKLEDKNELGNFTHIIMINGEIKNGIMMSLADMDACKKLINALGKKNLRVTSTETCVAFAAREDDALMASIIFDGDDALKTIEIASLNEVVLKK